MAETANGRNGAPANEDRFCGPKSVGLSLADTRVARSIRRFASATTQIANARLLLSYPTRSNLSDEVRQILQLDR